MGKTPECRKQKLDEAKAWRRKWGIARKKTLLARKAMANVKTLAKKLKLALNKMKTWKRSYVGKMKGKHRVLKKKLATCQADAHEDVFQEDEVSFTQAAGQHLH